MDWVDIVNESDTIKNTTPIVTHLTQVTISLLPEDHLFTTPEKNNESVTTDMIRQMAGQTADHMARVISMMELLAAHGFVFHADRKAIHGFSREMEAGEAKRLLLSSGFSDRDFQIVLEYTRGWGML